MPIFKQKTYNAVSNYKPIVLLDTCVMILILPLLISFSCTIQTS